MIKEFTHWLWSVQDDRRFKYHEGSLCKDRYLSFSLLDEPELVNAPVDDLAKVVWNAYLQGQVLLTQQKLGDGTYAYWATKTKEML